MFCPHNITKKLNTILLRHIIVRYRVTTDIYVYIYMHFMYVVGSTGMKDSLINIRI